MGTLLFADIRYEDSAMRDGEEWAADGTSSASPNSSTATDIVIHLERSPLVHVLETSSKGRGVFAKCDVPAKTLVEVSPILLVKGGEYEGHRLRKTIFESYLFTWSRSTGDMALALGMGSLFNHDPAAPNVSFELDRVNHTIRYTTSVNVKQGQELCIYYGHGVHFGSNGELLVDLDAKHSTHEHQETEDQALSAMSGLGGEADDDDEGGDDNPVTTHTTPIKDSSAATHPTLETDTPSSDETEILPLASLPLEFVTRVLAPEDMPLELVEVCVMNLEPKEVGKAMAFLGQHELGRFEAFRHCRHVRRLPDGTAQILVCPTSHTPADDIAVLVSHDTGVAHMRVDTAMIPANPARTPQQFRTWSASHWPVALVAIKEDVLAKARESSWTRGRLEWTEEMLLKTASLAEKAKLANEVSAAHEWGSSLTCQGARLNECL